MSRSRAIILALVLVVGVVAASSATAAACVAVPSTPRAVGVAPAQLRFLRPVEGSRGAWDLDTSWSSQWVVPLETVRTRSGIAARAFTSTQDTLRLRTAWRGGGTTWHQDPDSDTTCARDGMRAWTSPRVLVRETPKAVFVTVVARQVTAPTDGCITSTIDCRIVTVVRRLDAPIGTRQVYAQRFD